MLLCYSFLLFIFSFCADAEFITQPVSLNTSLNSTVTFTCEATGVSHIFFHVGKNPAAESSNVKRGFTELHLQIINGTIRRRQLSVHTREINNNSIIYCVASPGDIISDNATLTIQGLLDSVGDLNYTFINGSSVLLTWTAPYTLDNVPITGYSIVNGLVNITTTTNKSIILSATNPDPCILNNVSVSPINDAGIGSSNYISFYYVTVPLITPPVSVVPVIDGQLISLNISINVTEFCQREYPVSITVNILNINNEIQHSASISTQVNDQLMITGVITVPNSLNTFIVNVSLSNNGGDFPHTPSFGFGFLESVTNIDSSIDNCSIIDITWTAPTTVDDRVSILYYSLSIYDDITDQFLRSVSVYDTSYQFKDDDLFRHRYTYVITGVNELGEGISNNDTFSYQRVPRSVTESDSDILTFNETNATVFLNIPITLDCTGEAPENATVTIRCNETDDVYDDIVLVKYSQPRNITGSVPVPLNQQCNISIVFSNNIGSSEPFILAFDTTPTTPTIDPTTNDTDRTNNILVIGIVVSISVILTLIIIIVFAIIFVVRRRYTKVRMNHEWTVQSWTGTREMENEVQKPNHLNNKPFYSDIEHTSSNLGLHSVHQGTETTVVKTDEQEDDETPMSYGTVAEVSTMNGGGEMITGPLNKPKGLYGDDDHDKTADKISECSKTESTVLKSEATEGQDIYNNPILYSVQEQVSSKNTNGATETEEWLYLAPSISTKPALTQSFQYASIVPSRPSSKVSAQYGTTVTMNIHDSNFSSILPDTASFKETKI